MINDHIDLGLIALWDNKNRGKKGKEEIYKHRKTHREKEMQGETDSRQTDRQRTYYREELCYQARDMEAEILDSRVNSWI